MRTICSIEGCGRLMKAHGWCAVHYARWKRHCDPLGGSTYQGEPMRYFREVVLAYEGDECLPWPYSRDRHGYGGMRDAGKLHIVSRRVCEAANGPPPTADHEAAHSCGKGHEACVTKRHLSWKTHKENLAEMVAHGTSSRGERRWNSKLTEEQVLEIIALKGTQPVAEIAKIFPVSGNHIYQIFRGDRWSFLQSGEDAR